MPTGKTTGIVLFFLVHCIIKMFKAEKCDLFSTSNINPHIHYTITLATILSNPIMTAIAAYVMVI